MEIACARVLPSGALEYDRNFGLFDSEGRPINGKRNSAVHRLRSSFDPNGGLLSLGDENDGGRPATFEVEREGSDIEKWLREYFGAPVFFRRNEEMGFPDDVDSPGPTVVSVATLEEIGRWFGLALDEVRRRFRTNIEIDGVPPFWEDRLFGAAGASIRFQMGEAVFEGVNPCQRCVVPARDPWTGVSDDTFVRRFGELRDRTLPPWSRRDRFNHYYRVAINTRPNGDQGGSFLRVGDEVAILDQPAKSLAKIPARQSDLWAGELVVSDVRDEGPAVKTFRFSHPTEAKLPFGFLPGQFLTVTLEQGPERLQRCYTIASSPSDESFCEITVKRDGAASRFLHERVQSGVQLAVMGPMGRFTFDGRSDNAVVMIAGGIGVTPFMSKIRYLAARDWPGQIDLIYSAKTAPDIVFASELAALQHTYPRLRVHITLTAPDEAWRGARGRLSAPWLQAVTPEIADRAVRVCGPIAMAASVRLMLHKLGTPNSRIVSEAFGGRAGHLGESRDDSTYLVEFVRSGRIVQASGGRSILDTALAAGIAIDHGCRVGVCGRCRSLLLAGEVVSENDFCLSADEKDAGMILACQSKPTSPVSIG
jgi:ferredoxin-NADP reductase/uncharacterized protein YcbX